MALDPPATTNKGDLETTNKGNISEQGNVPATINKGKCLPRKLISTLPTHLDLHDLGQDGLVHHIHACRLRVVALQDLVILVHVERAAVVVLLQEVVLALGRLWRSYIISLC